MVLKSVDVTALFILIMVACWKDVNEYLFLLYLSCFMQR